MKHCKFCTSHMKFEPFIDQQPALFGALTFIPETRLQPEVKAFFQELLFDLN